MNKIYFLILILLLFPNFIYTQQAEWEWVKQAGEASDQIGSAIATDDDENVFITGYFYYKAIFENDTLVSQGESDIYIAKYDNSGNLCWVKQAGGVNHDWGHDITVDNLGNVYVTGNIGGSGLAYFGDSSVYVYGNTDIFLAKYDNIGNFQWVKRAGGNYTSYNYSSWDCGRSVITDSENNVFVTGSFRDTALFNTDTLFSYGNVDIFLAKYSENGELIWANNYGSTASDNGNVIVIDQADNLYLGGWFDDTISIADTFLIPQDGMDNFILKLTNNGERIWINQIGGSTAYTYKTSIALDTDNNIYVTDYFADTVNLNDTSLIANGNIDFYLSKYDLNGTFLWAKQYFDVFNIQSLSLTIDPNKNLYISGSYRGTVLYQNNILLTPYGIDDLFVAKFDNNGNFIWIISAGGSINDHGKDIICDNNNVYITGWFEDVATFGNIILSTYGSYDNRDIYVAKIKDNTVQINQVNNNLILSIFPNPNNGIFSLKTNGLKDQVYFEISNFNGQILHKNELIDNVEQVNISNYPPGLYILKILTEDYTRSEKVIKY